MEDVAPILPNTATLRAHRARALVARFASRASIVGSVREVALDRALRTPRVELGLDDAEVPLPRRRLRAGSRARPARPRPLRGREQRHRQRQQHEPDHAHGFKDSRHPAAGRCAPAGGYNAARRLIPGSSIGRAFGC